MSIYDDDDDFGPPDSDFGDSESDHVWADLARSEAEPPPNGWTECPPSPDGHCEYPTPQAEVCRWCGR